MLRKCQIKVSYETHKKINMPSGSSQQAFETSVDNLCTNEVTLSAVVPGNTLAAITTLIFNAPETLGVTALRALLLSGGVSVAKIVPVYNVYISHSKAISSYKLLTGY